MQFLTVSVNNIIAYLMQRVSELLTSMQNAVGIDGKCIYSTYRRVLIRHVTLYDFEILKRHRWKTLLVYDIKSLA